MKPLRRTGGGVRSRHPSARSQRQSRLQRERLNKFPRSVPGAAAPGSSESCMPDSAGLDPETVAQDDGQKPSQPLAEWYEIQPDDPDSDYDDECAIYDDDSADKSSVSEETSNSRYPLIILFFKKKTRDRGMGNVVPPSTPALPWNLLSQPTPPILDVSFNDFDDAPLIMSRGKSSVPLKSITEAPPCSAI